VVLPDWCCWSQAAAGASGRDGLEAPCWDITIELLSDQNVLMDSVVFSFLTPPD
jgi:hypothetical protein